MQKPQSKPRQTAGDALARRMEFAMQKKAQMKMRDIFDDNALDIMRKRTEEANFYEQFLLMDTKIREMMLKIGIICLVVSQLFITFVALITKNWNLLWKITLVYRLRKCNHKKSPSIL